MGQLDDDIMSGEEPDDEDHVICRRCGAGGLYWQERWLKDGRSTHVLVDNETNRPHVCKIKDNFGVVEE